MHVTGCWCRAIFRLFFCLDVLRARVAFFLTCLPSSAYEHIHWSGRRLSYPPPQPDQDAAARRKTQDSRLSKSTREPTPRSIAHSPVGPALEGPPSTGLRLGCLLAYTRIHWSGRQQSDPPPFNQIRMMLLAGVRHSPRGPSHCDCWPQRTPTRPGQ
jgi:hypothetical protein